MRSSRVYELIYTLKNLYNNFILPLDIYLRENDVLLHFWSGFWYYLQVYLI